MCRPPGIRAKARLRTARRSVPAPFAGPLSAALAAIGSVVTWLEPCHDTALPNYTALLNLRTFINTFNDGKNQ